MTGPAQPASNFLQKACQRLQRLGLTEEHVLGIGTPPTARFVASQLDPVQSDPHFQPLAQRVLRFLRGGRGLSVAVTDDGERGDARVHTALHLATSLARQGIQVVVVDMDFRHAGLQGLIEDPASEGIIDMVRFGRSCRSVLTKPVDAGPALLAAGSFPVQETSPLDEDAVRSILHRVSLHCELALYVTPLRPDGRTLNPVVRLCEHVVLVQSVSEDSVDIVEHVQLMQQARLHVAGVVLFDAARRAVAPGYPDWRGVAAPPVSAGGAQPAPEPETPLPPGPFDAADADTSSGAPEAPAAAVPEPPAGMPHIPWTGRPAAGRTPARASAADAAAPGGHLAPTEPPGRETPSSTDAIPEIHLPDERPQGPFPAPGMGVRRPTAPEPPAPPSTPPPPTVPPPTPERGSRTETLPRDRRTEVEEPPRVEAPPPARARSGPEVIESLWSEPDPEQPTSVTRRDDADSGAFEDVETEFAYDDGSNWSRTPLYILITLLVLAAGGFGWALWTKRGIEQQVGEQMTDTGWIDEPATPTETNLPDDAAAMPEHGATLPAVGLQALEEEGKEQESGDHAGQSPGGAAPSEQDEPEEASTPTPRPAPEEPGEMTPVPVPADPVATTPVPQGGSGRPSRPGTSSGAAAAHEYTVHVGSFRHLEQAYQDIATLQKHGFVGRAVKTDLGNKGVWYRVYVGGFPTRPEAERARDSILELPEYRYAQVKRIPR